MKIKITKTLCILIVLFVFLALMDFGTTFAVGDLLPYLEANPLYPIIGIWGIVGLNIIILAGIIFAYQKKSPFGRYVIITAVTWLTWIRTIVVFNNIEILNQINSGELTEEVLQQYVPAAETAVYFNEIALVIGILMLLSYAIYYLFQLDHKIEAKDG